MHKYIDYENTEGADLKDTLYSKAVLKTLNILEQFNKYEEMGIKDLSEATGIPPSTVQRMVNTLVMKQYLQKGANQKYHLGLAFFSMRSRYTDMSSKIESAKKYMEAFTQSTKETINLATLRGSNVVYLTKIESPHIVRPNFDIGKPFPAVNTSLGRSLISELEWDRVEEIYDEQENPNVSKEELKQILEEVRKNGYATEDEQFEKGLWCTSAPVRDNNGEIIAAVSTSVPKARLDEGRQEKLIEEIVKAAQKVTKTIGG